MIDSACSCIDHRYKRLKRCACVECYYPVINHLEFMGNTDRTTLVNVLFTFVVFLCFKAHVFIFYGKVVMVWDIKTMSVWMGTGFGINKILKI